MSRQADSRICSGYDYADLREFLETVPQVESAGRWTLAISRVAAADDPDGGWRQLVPVAIDPEAIPVFGTPIVVEGRLADPDVAAEATINEEEAARLGVGVGDHVIITPYRSDEFDLAGEGSAAAGGIPTTVTVVGITRRPNDLVGRLGGTSIYEDTSAVTVGPGWWKEIGGDAAAYGIGVSVLTTSPGAEADVVQTVKERWPDRLLEVDFGEIFGQDSQQTVPRCDPAPNGRALPDCRRHRARRVPVRGAGGLEAISSRVDRCGGARCDGDDPW